MYEKLYRKIALWSLEYEDYDQEEIEVVIYGIGVIIENIVKCMILMFIGLILHQFIECLLILISFCGLRICSGGIHAKTSLGCTVFMITIEVSVLGINQFIKIPNAAYILIIIISNILICLYAPNGCESCMLLDESAKRRKKRHALFLANIMFCIAIVFEQGALILISVFYETISLLLFEICRRKINERNKKVGF